MPAITENNASVTIDITDEGNPLMVCGDLSFVPTGSLRDYVLTCFGDGDQMVLSVEYTVDNTNDGAIEVTDAVDEDNWAAEIELSAGFSRFLSVSLREIERLDNEWDASWARYQQ